MPTLTKQAPERRFSGAVAHDFGSLHRKEKAPEVSPRRYALGIDAFRSRPQARFFASEALKR